MANLRNYYYISDSKVDGYLNQGRGSLKFKEAELKTGIDKGLLGTVGAKLVPREDRIKNLELVEKRLRKELRKDDALGGVADEKAWMEGTIDAVSFTYPGNTDLMLFLGRTQQLDKSHHYVALNGSRRHVLGEQPSNEYRPPLSNLDDLLANWNSFIESNLGNWGVFNKSTESLAFNAGSGVHSPRDHPGLPWLHMISYYARLFDDGQPMRISFLARRIVPDETFDGDKYSLGSPLFVTAANVY